MAGRGVHFAVDVATVARLRAAEADSDEAVLAVVAEVEEAWEDGFHFETDKAWDALHRCLTDGTLDVDGGGFPLAYAVAGGEPLHEGDEYFVALVEARDVAEVAAALAPLDGAWLRERYAALDFPDYQGVRGAEDLDYLVANAAGFAEFFRRAAEAGRAVVFTVDP